MDGNTNLSLTSYIEDYQLDLNYDYQYFSVDSFASESEGSESSSSSDSESETGDGSSIDSGDVPERNITMADCTHEDRFPYPYIDDPLVEAEAIANTLCDFGDSIPQGTDHHAFPDDYQGPEDTRRPDVCANCFAVICDECSRGVGEED